MSAETKFTSGPWSVNDSIWPGIDGDSGRQTIVMAGDRNNEIEAGIGGFTRDERIANAHLIAAAPELYEALDELLACIPWHAYHREVDKALAALRKARGETP